jgi:hypothetical protein
MVRVVVVVPGRTTQAVRTRRTRLIIRGRTT